MTKDYLPRREAVFHTWQDVFLTYLLANCVRFGLTTALIDPLITLQIAWRDAWMAASNPDTRTRATIKAKNETMAVYKATLRQFVREYLRSSSKVSDADRMNMGLPVADKKPTPAPAPTTRPVGEIDFSQYLTHILHVRDSVAANAARPAHTSGFEVRRKIGGDTAPGIDEMELVDIARRSPYRMVYASIHQNKRAWYTMRWVSTRGDKGPWSEIISAIIP
jgi:hypothetical protein